MASYSDKTGGESSDEWIGTVFVTTTFDAYRNFFDDEWAKKIDQITEGKRGISDITLDLIMEWKAAAYTASLPATIIEHMAAYHNAFVNTGEINTILLELAAVIPGRLSRDLPELTVDPASLPRIREKLVEIGAEVAESRKRAKVEFPLDDTWKSYLQDHDYQLSLWGSQRVCFVSIYNSYENFLVRTLCCAQSIDSCRTTDKDFKKRLVDSFGESIRDQCWTAYDVNIARLARHALSHAGGRLTAPLAGLKHGFEIRQGRIQVTTENNKALFAVLNKCVYSLAERAVTMPEFA